MKNGQSKILIFAVIILLIVLGGLFMKSKGLERQTVSSVSSEPNSNDPLYQKFQTLSTQGNSSCSLDFKNSISQMSDTQQLQGSCCSAMVFHRYKEQVEGLRNYSNIPQVPPDPYDIPASLAKELLKYDEEITLTSEEQKEYDKAMSMSEEKGPCCCKCWRWYVYEGLGKYLIRNNKFTGEQITDIWNLSDGCGGDRHVPGVHTG